jgi:hypothetical protein
LLFPTTTYTTSGSGRSVVAPRVIRYFSTSNTRHDG